MGKYTDIFFDLDHTLWDFKVNSEKTLEEAYTHFKLGELGCPGFESFAKAYKHYNEILWNLYRNNRISKEVLRGERFRRTLYSFGIKDKRLAEDIGMYYVSESPKKNALFPGATKVLAALNKRYRLHIITNGFEEVQHTKLKFSGLESFFIDIITSERAGSKKPNRVIFDFALKLTGADAVSSLMVGDNQEVDVLGARNAGMDQVFFNPDGEPVKIEPTYEIRSLTELEQILL